ncbi:MAG: iron chelate uptake ABC transporter family permease subunit, partial [Myxococcota bacterium]
LDGLLLGEAEAAHIGISVESAKRWGILLSAAAVGASVALTGLIGFIGLVVPHLVRLIIGPRHLRLIFGAAGLGAILLTVADVVARTTIAPAELPIGIMTAFLGVPFFLFLLARSDDTL